LIFFGNKVESSLPKEIQLCWSWIFFGRLDSTLFPIWLF